MPFWLLINRVGIPASIYFGFSTQSERLCDRHDTVGDCLCFVFIIYLVQKCTTLCLV